MNILKVVGGEPISDAVRQVQQAPQHIVVGTPGRVAHMIETQVLDVTSLKLFVLDESDTLLSQGFQDKILEISELLPQDKQTVFMRFPFSLLLS